MVDVDGAGEGARGELAGGDGGEDLTDRVDHVPPQVVRGEEVVHRGGAQAVEHPGQEEVRQVDDAKQEEELEDLTEEELGQVPVVLPESEHEGLHRVPPPVVLEAVLPDLLQAEAGHPTSLEVVPHEGRHQERHGLQFVL